jgi:hypothetical protein
MTNANGESTPADPTIPNADVIQNELDRDLRHERVLIPKAIVALAVVAVLVVIRQLFFV